MSEFFNTELLMRACKPIGLWTKFLLLFRPVNYSKDLNCMLKFKEMDGHVFILEYSENPTPEREGV